MGIGGRILGGLGSSVALAGLSSCSCSELESGQNSLYTGTRAAPLVGLWLSPLPVVFFRNRSGNDVGGAGKVLIELDEGAALTSDWRHVVRHRALGGKTHLRLDQGPTFTLAGVREPIPDPSGTTLLVVQLDPDDPDRSLVELLDHTGQSLSQFVAVGLEWAVLSNDGARIVLGTVAGVRVLAASGQELRQLDAADLGALSDDGAWLALEREVSGRRQLELTPLAAPTHAPSWPHAVPGRASSLVFAGAYLLRVAPERLQVFDTSSAKPVVSFDRAAPPDFEWRDAARAPGGTLFASRIHVERHAILRPSQQGAVYDPGAARVGVERFDPTSGASRGLEWTVTLWNHESPQIALDPDGTLYAVVWPSAVEVRIP